MLLFKDIFGKKVESDFNGCEVTTDAGLLFHCEVEDKIHIVDRISKIIHDNRHPGYIEHDAYRFLKQRVFQIASGYEDCNDCDELRDEPVVKISCDKLPSVDSTLASQPIMSRFENTPSRTDLYRISLAFTDAFIDSYKEPPEGIILDIDDTNDPTHDNQQMALFNSHHHTKCYMPITHL